MAGVIETPDGAAALGSIPEATHRDRRGVGLEQQSRVLFGLREFWFGLALKLACSALLGGTVATKKFTAFLYQFSHHPLADPYAAMLERGLPEAFPYGPVMLFASASSWFPFAWLEFDPSGHLGLFLLRVPVLLADLAVCLLLLRFLETRAERVARIYWLNPVLIYAAYVHGQLDLVPTAFCVASLVLLFERRYLVSAILLGLGIGAKLHLLIAAPLLVLHIFRTRRQRSWALPFSGIVAATTFAVYTVTLSSPSFRRMVFDTPQSEKLWMSQLAYGDGVPVALAPAFLCLAVFTFAAYRRVDRELTTMFLGAVYLGLMALVPPQPGWFLWSLPFIAVLGARFDRTRKIHIAAFAGSYLLFYFIVRPGEVFSSLDPLLGSGFGVDLAQQLEQWAPGVFVGRGPAAARSLLFCTTVLLAAEMFQRGVAANASYGFRERPFMVGIGGDSGSGKHTIGADLEGLMGRQLTTIHGDDDHKWERGHPGWKSFSHLDPRANLLVDQYESLVTLRRGETIMRRHYDHDVGRFTEPFEVGPNVFLSIIGLHPFYLPSQRALLDLKVFMQPDEEVRREWKIRRDMAKRGYTRERVLAQIEQRVPDGERYLIPQMRHSDVVFRVRSPHPRGAPQVDLEIEIATTLDSLSMVDVFDRQATLTVTWTPSPELDRDRIGVEGTLSQSETRSLAERLVPDLDHLVENEHWAAGSSGLMQAVLLHGISARLRSGGGPT